MLDRIEDPAENRGKAMIDERTGKVSNPQQLAKRVDSTSKIIAWMYPASPKNVPAVAAKVLLEKSGR